MLQKSYKLAKLCIIALLFIAPAMCQAATGAQSAEVVLFRFADFPNDDGTCTTTSAGDVVFNQYNNWLFGESRGLESISANPVRGPFVLPHPLAYYGCTTGEGYTEPSLPSCVGVGNLAPDSIAIANQYFDWHQRSLVVFVYNRGFGASTGAPFVFTSCQRPECPTCAHLDLPTMKHEGGHAQPEHLFHASDWTCNIGDVGTDLEDPGTDAPSTGVCNWATYGDSYDPMGGGIATGHYSTYMRWRLNWTQHGNVESVTRDDQAILTRADIATNEVQEVRIPLTPDYYYTLEYRSGIGVLIRYQGAFNVSDSETFIVNHGNPITYTDPFYDPFRGITVTLIGQNSETATIQVDYDETIPPVHGGGGGRRERMINGGTIE